jgi:hypothetical protein
MYDFVYPGLSLYFSCPPIHTHVKRHKTSWCSPRNPGRSKKHLCNANAGGGTSNACMHVTIVISLPAKLSVAFLFAALCLIFTCSMRDVTMQAVQGSQCLLFGFLYLVVAVANQCLHTQYVCHAHANFGDSELRGRIREQARRGGLEYRRSSFARGICCQGTTNISQGVRSWQSRLNVT